MKIFSFVGLLVLGFMLGCSSAIAADRTISVQGSGNVSVVPDKATVMFEVSSQNKTVKEAMAIVSKDTKAVMKLLTSGGVDAANIRTQNFGISPVYFDHDNDHSTLPQLAGYHVVQHMSFSWCCTAHDFTNFSVVLGELGSSGLVDAISTVSFSAEKSDELLSKARELAMQDACAKADQLASQGGMVRGSPVSIVERTMRSYGGMEMYTMPARTSSGAADMPVAAGTQNIAVTVDVVFSMSNP